LLKTKKTEGVFVKSKFSLLTKQNIYAKIYPLNMEKIMILATFTEIALPILILVFMVLMVGFVMK